MALQEISMRFSCDRHGFPILELEEDGLALALLPFSKAQFEQVWVEAPDAAGSDADEWYERVLELNPRTSWRTGSRQPLFGLWLTGVSPQEAAFLSSRAQGGAFDLCLPDAQEWLSVEARLSGTPFGDAEAERIERLPLCDAARAIWGRLRAEQAPSSWADCLLLEGGVLEWVRWSAPGDWKRPPSGFGALGTPPGTTFVPRYDGPRRYDLNDPPSRLHGFRLWRRRSQA